MIKDDYRHAVSDTVYIWKNYKDIYGADKQKLLYRRSKLYDVVNLCVSMRDKDVCDYR